MLDIKKLLTKILTRLNDLSPQLAVSNGSFSATISGSSYADITHTYQKAGFYPLGVVGFTLTSTNATWCMVNRCFLSARSNGECTVTLRARNTNSGNATPTVDVYVLWQKIL